MSARRIFDDERLEWMSHHSIAPLTRDLATEAKRALAVIEAVRAACEREADVNLRWAITRALSGATEPAAGAPEAMFMGFVSLPLDVQREIESRALGDPAATP